MDVQANGTISKNGTNKNNHKSSRRYVVIQNKLSLDPVEPVPINFSGDSFQYARDKKYIPFLDSNDNLANLLLEARLGSATQHACIDSISRSLVGKGIAVEGLETPNKLFFDWTKNVNNKGQSFTEFLIQTVDGERAFGNQFIEVKRGKVGAEKYIKVYLHSFLFSRLKSMPDFTEPTDVVLSKLIAKKGYQTFGKKSAIEIPLWNPSKVMESKVWTNNADGSQSTMLHFKNEISGIENYGLPGSVSSLRYQAIEAKLAQYNIDNLDNNLILGGILQIKGGLTQPEAESMAEDILMTHIGQGKTGRIAVVASEDGLEDTKFTPFNTEKEGSFLEFDKQVQEKIIISNAWDSVLAGINRNSTLGNGSQYIRSIWDVKDANLIHPLRTKLIEKVIKPIAEIFADWMGAEEINNYNWKLQTSMPFSYMADLDPNKFFQVNEAREKAGLKPDEKMNGKYLAEVTGPKQGNQFNNGFTQTDGTNKPGEKNNTDQTKK
jgi:hypothetical protein